MNDKEVIVKHGFRSYTISPAGKVSSRVWEYCVHATSTNNRDYYILPYTDSVAAMYLSIKYRHVHWRKKANAFLR